MAKANGPNVSTLAKESSPVPDIDDEAEAEDVEDEVAPDSSVAGECTSD